MSGPVESVFSLKPWSAYGKKGAFDDGDFQADASLLSPITDGDTSITFTAYPTDFFAPVDDPLPANKRPAVGIGHRFLFDPGGPNEQVVEIARMDLDPSLTVHLKRPLVITGGPLTSPVDLGMGFSPVLHIGNFPKNVVFQVTGYARNSRDSADTTSVPDVTFEAYFSANKSGPWVLDPSISIPAVPVRNANDTDSIVFATALLPSYNYMRLKALVSGADAGDTLFALEVVRSQP